MSLSVIVGAYWGDEGKGKCSNCMAKNADIVIRATGGANAGHTIVTGGQKYALHLLPSSIVNEKVKSIIAPGVVVDLQVLTEELEMIKKAGIHPNLYISDRARIVLPTDKEMDEFIERIRQNKIGTTKRGIGPAYANKAYRFAITMGDLLKPSYMLEDKIKVNAIWGKGISSEPKIRSYIREYRDYLIPYVHNTQEIINESLDEDRNILIEGSQSIYSDIDHGDGIYTTSCAVTASGLLQGAGIGPADTDVIIHK